MSSSPEPVILLLIPHDLQTYALAVGDILLSRFGLRHVLIRSTQTPADRLLLLHKNQPSLFVVLGPSTSSTSILETESTAPIITLTSANDVATTALAIAKCCSLASTTLREIVEQVTLENRQARLVQDAQLRTSSPFYANAMATCYDQQLQITGDSLQSTMRGKVRDRFELPDQQLLALVTTDRQSGFDRMLAKVPFKGAVLNLTSAFWFEQTASIIPNHLVAVPHPYISVCRKCKPFPIEFVVRSYMTGSTSTSIWSNYQKGVRSYCGHELADGMVKNQKLPTNLLTPTTKEEEHDRPISMKDIVDEQWMTPDDLEVCAEAALKVFALGQQIAAEHGLILVDTKYEFGRDEETGEILLIDEVHTPDSSRYWLASTYQQKVALGQEPDNIDKEFLRLWFRDNCDPYNDEVLPEAPRDLVLELARRYITLYEMITWKDFPLLELLGGESSLKEAMDSLLRQS
ncbi:phosphoribosylaminoimidazole-succinocarboxamide synthase [Fistulifera solaris]|uniref:phosphoribosylaminoimidazolesuccinocarboxamide synthase n=1 Tax=Fistulifera solaris TaxID=1519565 RepID=A0A1Z5KJK8_FISSO|nr:phosphoribosylaminoimidazole-succinocarboxamide synthase [Fistulifera solaris]|eukprot:GAX26231.1 phosphoribosylaminoimidazole-succinocarboxamide synthase [Fistulifera solaris]